ncbi:lysophospholipid acyltransferase family protein [Herbidospora mongoliensis]|uniref:lysophospholipid acyltransferase family protein n=1 Tax=Herbidospora mongoliensis TaxID=688067 RepID=UPI000B326AEF|nr:lysophospholipid acyltransferase family protein [Herbidospora mongoliensis]
MTITAPPMRSLTPWLPLAPCEPVTCVAPARRPAGVVRQTARLTGAVLVLLAGLVFAMFARRLSPDTLSRITMAWSRLLLRTLGVKVSVSRGFSFVGGSAVAAKAVSGEAGSLMVANHISWLDPLVMAAVMPARLLAKSEIAAWPLIRTLVAGSGAIFIDRERLSLLPGTVGEVTGALRAGDTVIAFPEGTTWCGQSMGGFRPAMFQAAIDAGAAVRPATIRYTEDETTSARPSYVGGDSLVGSITRVASTKHMIAEVTLFPPVGGAGQTRRSLAGVAEAQVRTGLGRTPAGLHS